MVLQLFPHTMSSLHVLFILSTRFVIACVICYWAFCFRTCFVPTESVLQGRYFPRKLAEAKAELEQRWLWKRVSADVSLSVKSETLTNTFRSQHALMLGFPCVGYLCFPYMRPLILLPGITSCRFIVSLAYVAVLQPHIDNKTTGALPSP